MSNLIKNYFTQDAAQNKFKELLGERASAFATSVLQIVASNKSLANAEPQSVFNAACMAATLNLPVNQNLGFAYILPYKAKDDKGNYVDVAQFQMGYKGFIQLAQRSGQFKTISATPIYKGQLISQDPLKGFEFDFTKKESEEIIGYAAYFSLTNGFEKTIYSTVAQLNSHGLKYSQTFKKGFGLWKDNFDAMAVKTVLKELLSKYAPLSIEMQKAVLTDQSLIKGFSEDNVDVEYVDNQTLSIEEISNDKELNRIKSFIDEAKTIKKLDEVKDIVEQYGLLEDYYIKRTELNGK
jgi:recombination protein RecT